MRAQCVYKLQPAIIANNTKVFGKIQPHSLGNIFKSFLFLLAGKYVIFCVSLMACYSV